MLPRRHIGWFFLRAAVFYGLLAAPWPRVSEAYSVVYSGVANLVFGSFGSKGVVRLEPAKTSERGKDTLVIVRTRGRPQYGKLTHDSRTAGYLPTVEVIALILATTIPWKRRWKALFWGFVLVNGFIALRLGVMLLDLYSGDMPWAFYAPGPFWSRVLSGTCRIVGASLTLGFVAPVFIWILVTFRREDLGHFIEAGPGTKGQS